MKAPRQWITLDQRRNLRKLTRLTAFWYVTELLAKLITYNIKNKTKTKQKAKKPS